MKLIIAIVQREDADRLLNELLEHEFRVTKVTSSGALLRRENVSLLIGIEDLDVGRVLSIIRRTCRRRKEVVIPYAPAMEPGLLWLPENFEVEVGGATVFVLPVERMERY